MGNCCSSDPARPEVLNTESKVTVRQAPPAVDYRDSDDDAYSQTNSNVERGGSASTPSGREPSASGGSGSGSSAANKETGATDDVPLSPEQLLAQAEEDWKTAVQESNNKELKKIFQTYRNQVDFATIYFENGDNSLHYAARTGNVKLAKLLLLIGIKIDEVNQVSGNTALHYAVLQNHDQMVRLLIKNNADTNVMNKYNKIPKDVALAQGNHKIQLILSQAEEKSGGLTLASPMSNSPDGSTDVSEDDLEARSARSTSSGIPATPELPNSPPNKNDMAAKRSSELAKQSTYMKLGTLSDETKTLPSLEGWLEKKKNKAPHNWHKRWVIVAKPYILWSDQRIIITDGNDAKERAKFKGYISMLSIKSVTAKKSKKGKQLKFIIVARDPRANQQERDYSFKCETELDRDQWVEGLNQYVRFFRNLQDLVQK